MLSTGILFAILFNLSLTLSVNGERTFLSLTLSLTLSVNREGIASP
jgi:hypothetical protein